MSKTLLAIDFGTTSSVAYVYWNGHSSMVQDDTGVMSFPSLVAYKNGNAVTCNLAKRGKITGMFRYVVSCVKRLIGLSYDEYQRMPDPSIFGCDVVRGDDGYPRFVVSDDGMQKDCIEVASEIFATIKRNAERMTSKDAINECYVTVPANYLDNQREAIKEAATRAGLKVMGIISEPTAAAISWCAENKESLQLGEKMLVFDFGGGTLDLSIIEYEGKGKFEVIATDGDPRLGGSDVDMEVAKLVIKMVRDQEDSSFDPLKTERKRVRFLTECENTKMELSYGVVEEMDLSSFGLDGDYEVTRNQLASIFSNTLKSRIDACLDRILMGPSRCRGAIKHVFLVGGSTRLVALQDYMHSLFHCEFPKVDPETCVAEGALTVARSLKDPSLGYSIIEILPYSYGLLCSDSAVVMLLTRGMRVPCKSSRLTFGTNEDYVPYITSAIYQWNGREMNQSRTLKPRDECTYIKDYRFENPDPKPRDQQTFDIHFELGVGGTLEVICCDHTTGKEMNHTTYRALVSNWTLCS